MLKRSTTKIQRLIQATGVNLSTAEQNYLIGSNFENRFKLIYETVSSFNNLQSICEIGCRTSILSFLLGKLCKLKKISGIDIDDDFLSIAQRRGIDARKCNINDQRLPYEDETFDVVLFCEVLEHIPNYHFAMNQIYRIIKKNGTLILTTPNVARLRNRMKLLFGKDVHDVYSENQKDVHIREYTSESVTNLLEIHNLKVYESRYLTGLVNVNSVKNIIGLTIKTLFPCCKGYIYIAAQKIVSASIHVCGA